VTPQLDQPENPRVNDEGGSRAMCTALTAARLARIFASTLFPVGVCITGVWSGKIVLQSDVRSGFVRFGVELTGPTKSIDP
jgi:hypothetical protein